jgi:hypothetical protein
MAKVDLYYANLAAYGVIDMMTEAVTGPSNSRFVRRNSRANMAIIADAVGLEYRVFTQNRTIVERSTLDSGGTDGQFPNLDEKGFSFNLAQGEILAVEVRETANVATTDIMMTIDIRPG